MVRHFNADICPCSLSQNMLARLDWGVCIYGIMTIRCSSCFRYTSDNVRTSLTSLSFYWSQLLCCLQHDVHKHRIAHNTFQVEINRRFSLRQPCHSAMPVHSQCSPQYCTVKLFMDQTSVSFPLWITRMLLALLNWYTRCSSIAAEEAAKALHEHSWCHKH